VFPDRTRRAPLVLAVGSLTVQWRPARVVCPACSSGFPTQSGRRSRSCSPPPGLSCRSRVLRAVSVRLASSRSCLLEGWQWPRPVVLTSLRECTGGSRGGVKGMRGSEVKCEGTFTLWGDGGAWVCGDRGAGGLDHRAGGCPWAGGQVGRWCDGRARGLMAGGLACLPWTGGRRVIGGTGRTHHVRCPRTVARRAINTPPVASHQIGGPGGGLLAAGVGVPRHLSVGPHARGGCSPLRTPIPHTEVTHT